MNCLNEIMEYKFTCLDLLAIEKSIEPKAGINVLNWGFKPIPLHKRPINNPSAYAGCGVYGVFFKNELAYIGSYLGSKKNKNFFHGDIVADRWWTHIGSMTMRSDRLHIARSTLSKIKSLIDKNNKVYKYFSNITQGSEVFVDTGNLAPFKRVLFASVHDEIFLELDAAPADILKLFSFKYIKFDKIPANYSNEELISLIHKIEKNLILKFSPICNSTHARNNPSDSNIVLCENDFGINLVANFFQTH